MCPVVLYDGCRPVLDGEAILNVPCCLIPREATGINPCPVVGAAVPAAVCRWGLARAVLMWGGVSRG